MNWIDFEDFKPVEKGKYLIAVDSFGSNPFYELSFWDGKNFTFWSPYNDCVENEGEDVLAWMEIPEFKKEI